MSYKVLLPQPIRPEGYAYLRERGYEVKTVADAQTKSLSQNKSI